MKMMMTTMKMMMTTMDQKDDHGKKKRKMAYRLIASTSDAKLGPTKNQERFHLAKTTAMMTILYSTITTRRQISMTTTTIKATLMKAMPG